MIFERLAKALNCEIGNLDNQDLIKKIRDNLPQRNIKIILEITRQREGMEFFSYNTILTTYHCKEDKENQSIIPLEETSISENPFSHPLSDQNRSYILNGIVTISQACKYLGKNVEDKIKLEASKTIMKEGRKKQELESWLTVKGLTSFVDCRRFYIDGFSTVFVTPLMHLIEEKTTQRDRLQYLEVIYNHPIKESIN